MTPNFTLPDYFKQLESCQHMSDSDRWKALRNFYQDLQNL